MSKHAAASHPIHKRFLDFFPAGAALTRLATGFIWAEGPGVVLGTERAALLGHSQQPHHALVARQRAFRPSASPPSAPTATRATARAT